VSSQVSTTADFASADEALAILESAMGYPADGDPAALGAEGQARVLRGLEWLDATKVAARTSVLECSPPGRAIRRIAVLAALRAGEVTESYARTIYAWSDKLPTCCQDDADEVLTGAVLTGADLYIRSLPAALPDGHDADSVKPAISRPSLSGSETHVLLCAPLGSSLLRTAHARYAPPPRPIPPATTRRALYPAGSAA
jgi:hypothetical protein